MINFLIRCEFERVGLRMKSTGIIRKVDELGRIVLPMEIRRAMDIQEKDPIEIFTDNVRIILQKYISMYVFCGNSEDLETFRDKRICPECLKKIKQLD